VKNATKVAECQIHLDVVGGDEPRPVCKDAVHVVQPLQLGRRVLHTLQPLLITMLQ